MFIQDCHCDDQDGLARGAHSGCQQAVIFYDQIVHQAWAHCLTCPSSSSVLPKVHLGLQPQYHALGWEVHHVIGLHGLVGMSWDVRGKNCYHLS